MVINKHAAAALIVLIAAGTTGCSGATEVATANPPSWFVYLVVFVVLAGGLVAIASIRAAVGNSTWSLADALSEDVELTLMERKAPDQPETPVRENGRPVMVTVMRASSSRLIALMGMLAILLMFLGFGSFALYRFGATGVMPGDIEKVVQFLVAGMTLFAPYVVNKFASLFGGLAPRRPQ